MHKHWVVVAWAVGVSSLWFSAQAVSAQANQAGDDKAQVGAGVAHELDEVVVSDVAEEQVEAPAVPVLDAVPATGNKLGLTVRESPAVLDTITQEDIQNWGARATDEVLNRAPGVMSSNVATSPGALSLRGFTGAGRGLLTLYDGVAPLEEALFTRIMDSWMFDRIEVLQGPASVDYGQGALAGVINLVPKHPKLGVQALSAQLGFGSFNTFRAAADANVSLLDNLAVRPVVSYNRTDGYVKGAASDYLATSVGAKWAPIKRLNVDLAFDYSQDNANSAYMGTPLVPRAFARKPSSLVKSADGRVLDEALRDVNYNVHDGIVDADTVWLRSNIEYRINDDWSITNQASYYTSDRRFINAEYYGFNPETSMVDRSTGIVTHDIDYWIERLTLRGDVRLGRVRNRIAINAEYSELDYFTHRRFGNTTSVDPLRPDRGRFPVGDDPTIFGTRVDRDTGLNIAAVSVQDALNLTPQWRLTAGLRFDHIALDRLESNLNTDPVTRTPTDRTYNPVTWRVGTSYDVLPKTQVFAQYSTAASPPASLVALQASQTQFDMTTGWAVEAGVKSSLLQDRVALGVSGFYIQQDDIVTRSSADPTVSVQGGKQSSRGAELTLSARPIAPVRVDANYTVLDARFDRLLDAEGNSLRGKTPERIPEQILTAFVYYDTPVVPVNVSVGVHHTGRFFTDNANSIEVGSYTTLEAAVRYRLKFERTTLDFSLRGRNLTDALYASYTDMSPDQLTIAAPRSVDLLVTAQY